jgi:hypothetical protein
MRKWRPNQFWRINKTEVKPISKNEEAEIQPILEDAEEKVHAI